MRTGSGKPFRFAGERGRVKDRLLATRYAKALLAAVPDAATAETVDALLQAFQGVIARSAELRDALVNPAIPRRERKAILDAIAQQHGAPQVLRNFLGVLTDHNRAGALPAIAEVFRSEREKAAGVVAATLTTAAPITGEQTQRARTVLEKLTGRKVRLAHGIDPSLLGGAVTTVGSTVYDGSLRTQLAVLRRKMAEE